VRYPEASTAWRTFSLRPSLLNVILFPNMGCDQTGTAWNPLWIAVHSWASFRLATETPVQVHGTFRANEHRGTNLGCLDRAVLKQGQLKAADDSGDGLTLSPISSRRNELPSFTCAGASNSVDSACAELPRPVPDLNSIHACHFPRCQLVASLRFCPAGGANSFMTPKIAPRVAR
jgi:hypothetical protein